MLRPLVLLATLFATCSSWAMLPGGGMRCSAPPAHAGLRALCVMQSQDTADAQPSESAGAQAAPVVDEVAASAAEAVSDFTEDLLEALTTEDEPLVDDEPAVFASGAEGVELASLPSFDNAASVQAMRSKYALHDNDTGSSQVQIAVLTARIAYMTKHMQA